MAGPESERNAEVKKDVRVVVGRGKVNTYSEGISAKDVGDDRVTTQNSPCETDRNNGCYVSVQGEERIENQRSLRIRTTESHRNRVEYVAHDCLTTGNVRRRWDVRGICIRRLRTVAKRAKLWRMMNTDGTRT